MTRIAVHLFGNLRTIEKCVAGLKKNLLELHNCDVFVHTWTYSDHHSPTWYDRNQSRVRRLTKQEVMDQLNLLIPGCRVRVEEPLSATVTEGLASTLPDSQVSSYGVFSMFHSIAEVTKLRIEHQRKHQTKYHAAVYLRPDVDLGEPFFPLGLPELSQLGECIHFLHIVELEVRHTEFTLVPRMADVFFMLSTSRADSFINLPNWLLNAQLRWSTLLERSKSCPELIFTLFLEENCIRNRYIHYKYSLRRIEAQLDIVPQPWQALPPLSLQSPVLRFLFKLAELVRARR